MSWTPRMDSLALGELSTGLPHAVTLAEVGRNVTSLLADRLGVPTALRLAITGRGESRSSASVARPAISSRTSIEKSRKNSDNHRSSASRIA